MKLQIQPSQIRDDLKNNDQPFNGVVKGQLDGGGRAHSLFVLDTPVAGFEHFVIAPLHFQDNLSLEGSSVGIGLILDTEVLKTGKFTDSQIIRVGNGTIRAYPKQ